LRKSEAWQGLVASGLARARLRSSRKTDYLDLSDRPNSPILGALRTPARASPLATNVGQTCD
ncbi:hypothetical protein, partial [Pseudomonas gingeri]|uniref:hypothetical protein n=1 Tax=Pseudomonas gingeri TaxID=117681 RepID=UPI001C433084